MDGKIKEINSSGCHKIHFKAHCLLNEPLNAEVALHKSGTLEVKKRFFFGLMITISGLLIEKFVKNDEYFF